MNIAVFTRNLVGYGGIPYSLKYLSIGWKKQNLQYKNNLNYIILEDIDEELLKDIKNNLATVIFLNTNNRFKQFFKIFKILRKNNYDCILCTCFRTYMFTKMLAPFKKIILWFRGTNYLGNLFKKLFFIITNNTVSLVNSYYTARNNNLKKYKVIYNGVSDDFLNVDNSDFYNKFNIPKDSVVIGFIGGWVVWKNHITLIKAFNLLSEKYKNIYLICIGEHSELTTKVLREVEHKERVRFQDKISYASRYLKYFDLYIQPSYSEGFGNAVVESMYAGCPIVAAKAGALPELIESDVDGILYTPPTSPLECFYAIEKLLNNKSLANKLSDNARVKAYKNFSPEIFAKRFIGSFT